jgi:hypothetical protein
MTPQITAVLFDFAGRLGQTIAPDLKTPYRAGEASLMAAVLMMAAEDVDRAADRLAAENAAVRVLLDQGSKLAPATLASRWADLAGTLDADLKISTLQGANNTLRGALVELHAWVEDQGGPGAKALEAAVWRELAASTERRRSSLAPF